MSGDATMVKGVRSYQCERCSRSFARLEHLQRHDRSRMSISIPRVPPPGVGIR